MLLFAPVGSGILVHRIYLSLKDVEYVCDIVGAGQILRNF